MSKRVPCATFAAEYLAPHLRQESRRAEFLGLRRRERLEEQEAGHQSCHRVSAPRIPLRGLGLGGWHLFTGSMTAVTVTYLEVTERRGTRGRILAQWTPWAVLLCQFEGDTSQPPFPRQRFEELFTSAGLGMCNMVDFFWDMSHGNVDLSRPRVFG